MFREILSVVLLCIQAIFMTYIAIRVFVTSVFDVTYKSNVLVNRIRYERIPYKVLFFYNPVILIALTIMFMGSVK